MENNGMIKFLNRLRAKKGIKDKRKEIQNDLEDYIKWNEAVSPRLKKRNWYKLNETKTILTEINK